MKPDPATCFAVVRTAWHIDGMYPGTTPALYLHTDSPYRGLQHIAVRPEWPCSLHRTKADAEMESQRLTLVARPLLNPFWGSFWHDFPERQFGAFFGGLDNVGVFDELTPGYDADYLDWIAWWELCSPAWTDAQRNGVWDLLPEIVLYRVCEVEYEG